MSNYIGHLETASNITITTDKDILTVPSSHLSFEAIRNALGVGDYVEAIKLADATKAVNTFGEGQVYVQDGTVFYNGKPLEGALVQRMTKMMREGFDVSPLVKFLDNLMKNPSDRAVKELYRFLESNSLPITPDGHFLAYKNVSDDYTDKRTGTFDNSVGAVCQMPRNEVMDDPNVTCSTGLHFCSIEYLNEMWGHSGHTMVVKINPADVVSIPVDYNNSKGRCCKYEVIAEHKGGKQDTLSSTVVYSGVGYPYDKGYADGLCNDYQNPYAEHEGDWDDYDAGFYDGLYDLDDVKY